MSPTPAPWQPRRAGPLTATDPATSHIPRRRTHAHTLAPPPAPPHPQVTLQPATILGPELAVRQPVTGEVQYFEVRVCVCVCVCVREATRRPEDEHVETRSKLCERPRG